MPGASRSSSASLNHVAIDVYTFSLVTAAMPVPISAYAQACAYAHAQACALIMLMPTLTLFPLRTLKPTPIAKLMTKPMPKHVPTAVIVPMLETAPMCSPMSITEAIYIYFLKTYICMRVCTYSTHIYIYINTRAFVYPCATCAVARRVSGILRLNIIRWLACRYR